jgi:two-component system sensor histidine kinase VicK
VGVYSSRSFFELLWNEHIQYEQLKEADKMKNEFINIAAHELRNPIQPIIGLSEVLRSRTKNTDEHEFLDAIIRSAKRLQQLTDNILNVAQIENHSLKLNKERFNLTVLIINILKDYRNQLEENKDNGKGNVKLLYKNGRGKAYNDNEDLVFVEADPGRIAQVISNLLNNAIKFTKGGEAEDKTITIIVDNKDDKAVVVSVEDTGIGIDPEIFPKLFSKFITNSDTGTGLGLFISKNIVEAHGGKMWAENNNDVFGKRTRGARFCFTLPIIDKSIDRSINTNKIRYSK